MSRPAAAVIPRRSTIGRFWPDVRSALDFQSITVSPRMRPVLDLYRHERGARPFFLALGSGALGTYAGYIAIMLVAYQRLGSAWAASLILLAPFVLALRRRR